MFSRQVAAISTGLATIGCVVASVVIVLSGHDVPSELWTVAQVGIGATAGMSIPENGG